MDEQEANELAERVLAVDPSIISVGIINDAGTPLGGAIAKSSQGKLTSDKREWENQAFRAAAVVGITRTDDARLSPIDSVILIRRETESLLIRIPDIAIVAVIFEKTKRGLELSQKIREMLGHES